MNRSIMAIAASVLILGSASAMACDGGKRDHRGGGFFNLEKLDRVLELTDAQKSQLEAIKEQGKQDRRASMEDRHQKNMMSLDPSAADYQTQVQALADENAERAREKTMKMAEYRSQVYAVLTPEQRDLLKQKMEKRREKMQKRMQKWDDE
ncbi:hypothetical protein TDB9533_00386 [Thalassocella blandensis]|nr:hypothetical protein TDB9533_00386 [Thalassocella blandensis]